MSETSPTISQTDEALAQSAALHDALDASWEALAGDSAYNDAFAPQEEEPFAPPADDASGAAPEGEEDAGDATPGDFTAEEREAFAALPPEAQSLVSSYAARSQSSRTALANELDGLKRAFAPLGQALNQYAPYMQALGAAPDQVVAGLMPYYLRLAGGDEQTRRETIEHLARQFGVDGTRNGGAPSANDNADPQVKALKNELNALKAGQQAARQAARQQRFSTTAQEVDAFINQRDENGAPKYPDFDRLEDAMFGLLQGGLARGLEDAYAKAAALDPDYQAAARKRGAEAKRAASVNRRGSNAPAARNAALTIDDSISEAWDELYG